MIKTNPDAVWSVPGEQFAERHIVRDTFGKLFIHVTR